MGTVVITGGHAGLGLATATRLAARKEHLVLAGRNFTAVEKVAADLRARFGVNVTSVHLDLSSLASIRTTTTETRRMVEQGEIQSLDALLCNAGAQFRGPVSYSRDGYEETFATNHLGHFLMVNLLLDVLATNARVVFTASGTHDPETMDGKMVGKAISPDALALANEGKQGRMLHSGGVRYATSKLCTILFSYELARRLASRDSKIASIAYDPGFIPETGLSRTAPAFVAGLLRTAGIKWLVARLGVTMGSIPFSGEALSRIAVDPEYAGASGLYLQSSSGALNIARSSKASYDERLAAKLWQDSEALVQPGPSK